MALVPDHQTIASGLLTLTSTTYHNIDNSIELLGTRSISLPCDQEMGERGGSPSRYAAISVLVPNAHELH